MGTAGSSSEPVDSSLPLSSAIWSGTKRYQKPGELQKPERRHSRAVFEARERDLLGEGAAT
jgi:hypothetical protein